MDLLLAPAEGFGLQPRLFSSWCRCQYFCYISTHPGVKWQGAEEGNTELCPQLGGPAAGGRQDHRALVGQGVLLQCFTFTAAMLYIYYCNALHLLLQCSTFTTVIHYIYYCNALYLLLCFNLPQFIVLDCITLHSNYASLQYTKFQYNKL